MRRPGTQTIRCLTFRCLLSMPTGKTGFPSTAMFLERSPSCHQILKIYMQAISSCEPLGYNFGPHENDTRLGAEAGDFLHSSVVQVSGRLPNSRPP